jgi:outer membrane murein-binding lipoprotein Lpp
MRTWIALRMNARRSLWAALTVSMLAAGCASGPDPKVIDAKIDRLIAQHNQLVAAFNDHADRHARMVEKVNRNDKALIDNSALDSERDARWQRALENLNRSLHEHETELRSAIAVLRRLQVIRPTPDGPPMLVIRDR